MKLNQYTTDDTAADNNKFVFWNNALGKVRKTTWSNLVVLIRTALSNASDTVKGVIKLYPGVADANTDGAPTQAAVKAAVDILATGIADNATAISSLDNSKQNTIVPVAGWGGNSGPELRAGFNPMVYSDPDVQNLATYFNALINDLKSNKGIGN